MLSIDASGVFPIAPTPFLPDGRIDDASTDRMIDHYVAAGADGVEVLPVDGVENGAEEKVGQPDHRVHRSADLVAHCGQER